MWNYSPNGYPETDPRTTHKAGTLADLLPENETEHVLQCWATPAARRGNPPDARARPCPNEGTGRLGMCPDHAAEFIDGVTPTETAPDPVDFASLAWLSPHAYIAAHTPEDDAA